MPCAGGSGTKHQHSTVRVIGVASAPIINAGFRGWLPKRARKRCGNLITGDRGDAEKMFVRNVQSGRHELQDSNRKQCSAPMDVISKSLR
jgi:hypothetical protein